MEGPAKGRAGFRTLASLCLLLFVAAGCPARAECGGELPDEEARSHGRMTILSLRIAQAGGREGRVRRYKSLARQHRAGKNPPAALLTPGTRASRPGRTP